MPFYAVARGRQRGVFSSWDQCRAQVDGFSGAVYKKFRFAEEAASFAGAEMLPAAAPEHKLTPATHSAPVASPSQKVPQKRQLEPDDSPNLVKKPKSALFGIYVDGAARGNGKKGTPDSGYGVYYGPGDPRNAAVALNTVNDVLRFKPTNQRAELHAIHHALTDISRALEEGKSGTYSIYSDSEYAQKAVSVWSHAWRKNGWKNSTGKPVANRDIIEPTVARLADVNTALVARGLPKVAFHHVRGHAGDAGNEAADKLANDGADLMAASRKV